MSNPTAINDSVRRTRGSCDMPIQARIAVVILAWNSDNYISRCINSVLNISAQSLDIWVVDNGSTDTTPSILSSFAREHGNLHIITCTSNVGTTVSRNMAIRRIGDSADIICILDSDTVINQDAFTRLSSVITTNHDIGVVGPTLIGIDGNPQLSGRNFPTVPIKVGKAMPIKSLEEKASKAEIPTSPIINGFQDVDYLLSACWFIRMDVLKQVGLLDENIFYAPEDVDWCMRCHKAGYRVVRCYEAEIIHEYQRISHKKLFSSTNREHIKGLFYYFKKHRYAFVAPNFFERQKWSHI